MEDKDYRVIAVSPEPAKEFTNAFGTTYYRNVKIADLNGVEHPKPVSLGKKDPNAFQVGMELHGHILVEQSFPTDKFKSVSKQQGSFGGGFQKQGGGFSGGSRPAYKDNSDGQRQGMCFNNAANYVNILHAKQTVNAEEWARLVHEYANALYQLGDLGGETPDPKAPQTASNPAKLKPGDPVWPSDSTNHDDGDIASLLATGLQADGLDMPEGW